MHAGRVRWNSIGSEPGKSSDNGPLEGLIMVVMANLVPVKISVRCGGGAAKIVWTAATFRAAVLVRALLPSRWRLAGRTSCHCPKIVSQRIVVWATRGTIPTTRFFFEGYEGQI